MENQYNFYIEIHNVTIAVRHTPESFAGYQQFEFFSTDNPLRGIPISPTGYRSHFASPCIVAEYENPQAYAYAQAFCNAMLATANKAEEEQFSLF